jgi:holo-[acyl-carrier protein] synthase
MIYGIGTDLVEISRIEKILQRWGDRFIEKVYSPIETDYCQGKAFPSIHFAARFAAKESFLKSLGIGLGMGVGLKDIELINNEQGSPLMKVHNRAENILHERGVTGVHVSVTHTRKYASAVVILEK